MEKMEIFLLRMEKFIVRMEIFSAKTDVSGRIGAATLRQYLVAFRQDTRNVHNVALSTPKCDFGAENAAE